MTELDTQARAWRFSFRLLAVSTIITLMMFSILFFHLVPSVERAFEYTLGSRSLDKLPALTLKFVQLGRNQSLGLWVLALIGLISIAGVLLPKPRPASIFACMGLAFFSLHSLCLALAMLLPLVQLVVGIGS